MLTFDNGFRISRISLRDALNYQTITMAELIQNGLTVLIQNSEGEFVNIPERTPQLYVSFSAESSPVQHFQAVQLSNNWFPYFHDENAFLTGGFCASSHHPLDVWALDLSDFWDVDLNKITFSLDVTEAEIQLQFSDNFLPHHLYVRRWPANFTSSVNYGGSDMDLWFQYEVIEIHNNIFRINADGNDYIYEVDAIWLQGRSSYTFRIDNLGQQ